MIWTRDPIPNKICVSLNSPLQIHTILKDSGIIIVAVEAAITIALLLFCISRMSGDTRDRRWRMGREPASRRTACHIHWVAAVGAAYRDTQVIVDLIRKNVASIGR